MLSGCWFTVFKSATYAFLTVGVFTGVLVSTATGDAPALTADELAGNITSGTKVIINQIQQQHGF